MKHKMRIRSCCAFIFILGACIAKTPVTFATTPSTPAAHTATAEHGEEVYDPKSPSGVKAHTAKDDKTHPKENVEYKSYGSKAGERPPNSDEEEDSSESLEATPKKGSGAKSKLKEFTVNVKPKDSKNKLNESNIPVEVELSKSSAGEHKDEIKHEESLNTVEDEMDANDEKVIANKLVDTDHKAVGSKKYNGIFWFLGVFAVLLVVVFAFT